MADGFDDIVHQGMRLQIMAALDHAREPLDFSRLKAITRATDGNLGAHLVTLDKAGYVRIDKTPDGARTRTSAAITRAGRIAFRNHVAALHAILDAGSERD
jgi:DNA-binding MarR family transcriptional regulator